MALLLCFFTIHATARRHVVVIIKLATPAAAVTITPPAATLTGCQTAL